MHPDRPQRCRSVRATRCRGEKRKRDDGDGRWHRGQKHEPGPDHLVADDECGKSDDEVAQDEIAHDDPEQCRKEEGAGPAKDVAGDFHCGEAMARARAGRTRCRVRGLREEREGSRPWRGERSRDDCGKIASSVTSRTIAPMDARRPLKITVRFVSKSDNASPSHKKCVQSQAFVGGSEFPLLDVKKGVAR